MDPSSESSLLAGPPVVSSSVTIPVDRNFEVFDVTASINDNAYTGFNYKEQIFPRTLSNLIYANPQKIPILDKFQRVVFALIETVKEIKNYFNYTVPFNNRRVF